MLLLAPYTPNKSLTCIGILNASRQFAALFSSARGESLEQVIASLNPVLRGWFNYFKHAHHPVFKRLDGLVRRRLRAFLRKQEKRPGFGRCLADQMRWTNAFFAEAGLFALYTAW